MKLILLILPLVFSVITADTWNEIEITVPGCLERDILDCVAAFDGKMCFKGDVPFKRDCFECKCNVFGFWKCKNYCVNSFEGDQTINLSDLVTPNVSPEGIIVSDLCHPGRKFLQEGNAYVVCRCSLSGRESLSFECEKKFGCK